MMHIESEEYAILKIVRLTWKDLECMQWVFEINIGYHVIPHPSKKSFSWKTQKGRGVG